MQSTITQDPTVEERFRQQTEQFYCTNECCEAQIRREDVITDINQVTGVRTVQAWCRHCDRLHRMAYQLTGFGWSPLGEVEIVTDQRRVRAFLHRTAHLRGETQVSRTQVRRPQVRTASAARAT